MNEEEIVKKIYKDEERSILFTVKNGDKKLIRYSLKDKKKIILLDNIPLVSLSEASSPMDSSIIKLIKGRSYVDRNVIEKININMKFKNLEESFDGLKPFLKLLDDGEYEIKQEDMIPTDGENNYFWNCALTEKYYHASADIYHNGMYIEGRAKFLMPSQGTHCFDKDRVDYYREKIRNGEELLGIALELRGFIALLLDGHHKATASYLEGKKLKCLIIRCRDKNNKEVDISSSEFKECKTNIKSEKIKIDNCEEVFPNFEAIALGKKNIDTSIDRIEKLLKFQSNHPIEQLEEIFYNLTIYNKEKAKNLCFTILKKNEFRILWSKCLNYLSLFSSDDVESFFREMKDRNIIKYSLNLNNNCSAP